MILLLSCVPLFAAASLLDVLRAPLQSSFIGQVLPPASLASGECGQID
jgi:hypothetical protein